MFVLYGAILSSSLKIVYTQAHLFGNISISSTANVRKTFISLKNVLCFALLGLEPCTLKGQLFPLHQDGKINSSYTFLPSDEGVGHPCDQDVHAGQL